MRTRTPVILSLLLLLATAPAASAQTEQWVPYTLRSDQTAVRVWTSGERTHARVNIVFNDGGYRVTDIGPVVRQGNNVSVDFIIDRWTGGATQALVYKEYFFDLGALPAEPGTFTFTVKSRGADVRGVTFDPRQIVEHWEEASLERNAVGFTVWTTGGVTFTGIGLGFPDDGYRVVAWQPPARSGNDFVSQIRLERWTGRAETRQFQGDRRVFVLGQLPPTETFTVSAQFSDGVRHTSAPFTPAGTSRPAGSNAIDDPAFFVRQHYLDFFGREPDPAGLNFWYNELTNCVPFTTECVERRRESVSAAFYLSVEFQQTGFVVHRLYKAAFNRIPRFAEFLADTRRIGEGVVVNGEGWQERLEANTRQFVEEFAARAAFRERYPEAMTPEQYVDILNLNIRHDFPELDPGPLTPAEVAQLVEGLRSGAETRGAVLRKVANHPHLVQQEFNRAFVLSEYFGYLRRNPDDAPDNNWEGYFFWLAKLNSHRGDFQSAQMVRAFLVSGEYRNRFSPN
ncbi:MAG TPA: DUF4214 domain-containing protein [Pyrinomonadaceae bacterium]